MTFKDPITLGIDEINDAGDVLSEIAEMHPVDRSVGPELSAGDVDARWDEAESSGDEADEHRRELDPASADDYAERVHEETEAQPLLKMGHEHHERRPR